MVWYLHLEIGSIVFNSRSLSGLFLASLIVCLIAGCGGSSSSTSAPSANEYEAYLAENPDEAVIEEEDQDAVQ
ncbi:MAG: hypothetical protein AAF670_08920 [Planctomycetota bacterium]